MIEHLYRSSRSWQIQFGFPAELQFAAYVAREGGLSPADKDDGEARRQWQAWWDKWVENRAQRTGAAQPQVDNHAWLTAGFRPPDFEELREAPALRRLFRQRWPAFREGWAVPEGMKMQMAGALEQQLRRVKVKRLVDRQAKAMGLSKPSPFTLVVDFVHWPEDLVHERPGKYLLLGRGFLEASQADVLAARLRTAVAGALGHERPEE